MKLLRNFISENPWEASSNVKLHFFWIYKLGFRSCKAFLFVGVKIYILFKKSMRLLVMRKATSMSGTPEMWSVRTEQRFLPVKGKWDSTVRPWLHLQILCWREEGQLLFSRKDNGSEPKSNGGNWRWTIRCVVIFYMMLHWEVRIQNSLTDYSRIGFLGTFLFQSLQFEWLCGFAHTGPPDYRHSDRVWLP